MSSTVAKAAVFFMIAFSQVVSTMPTSDRRNFEYKTMTIDPLNDGNYKCVYEGENPDDSNAPRVFRYKDCSEMTHEDFESNANQIRVGVLRRLRTPGNSKDDSFLGITLEDMTNKGMGYLSRFQSFQGIVEVRSVNQNDLFNNITTNSETSTGCISACTETQTVLFTKDTSKCSHVVLKCKSEFGH